MPVIIAITNQKGGVGKTTTAVNLAAGLARQGVRTLLLDLDIQGSASAFLGLTPAENDPDVASALLAGNTLQAAVVATHIPSLSLAPAGERMSLVDLHLASSFGRERVLERALQCEAVQSHDVVIIDTAPYLGLLTVNALVAADQLIVPVSCEYLPMLGLKLLEETLGKLRTQAGARASVLGYALTMHDKRERITTEVEQMVRNRFGNAVFQSVIRTSTQHKIAPSHAHTIFEHEDASGRGHQDYRALTLEVMQRLGLATGVVATPSRRKSNARTQRDKSAASAGGNVASAVAV